MSERQVPPPRRSGASGCFIAILVVVLLVSIGLNGILMLFAISKGMSNVSSSAASTSKDYFSEKVVVDGVKGSKIAVIELKGVISFDAPGQAVENMVTETVGLLRAAGKDATVKGIVLYIDSPGGEVTAADTIYNEVRRVKEEDGKPVVIYMGSLTASGGYYIACGGSHLMANETTLTGSIGVIIQTINYRELFGKVGLEAMTFKSGEFKDMLSGSREMTPEEREYVNGLVMQMYDKFLNIVATSRGLSADTLRQKWADGRIISAVDAKEVGLIDSTGYVEDAYAKARDLAGAPGATIVKYESRVSSLFKALLMGEAKMPGTKVSVDLVPGAVPHLKPGYCYYLYMPSSGVAE